MSVLDITAQEIQYTIGDTWTYERTNDRLKEIYFEEIKLIDTLSIAGRSCYVLERGMLYGPADTMCVEEQKVYFWDENSNQFQLQYDYGADSVFTAEYVTNNIVETYDVFVDSIKLEEIRNGIIIPVHYFRSHWGYGGSEYTRRSYRGIGQDRHHPRYTTGGLILDEFEESNRVLRCFEHDSAFYQFVDYPCDTTWIFPDTMDLANTIFSIGDTWTYEEVELPNPYRFGFYEIKIIDTTVWMGKEVFVIEPGLETDFDYIYETDGEIYFWDFDINTFQKYYDFNAATGEKYNIAFIDKGPIGSGTEYTECTVTVDSLSSMLDENMEAYQVQHLSFDCTNNRQFSTEVYIGIGHTYQHPRLQLWETIADPKILPNGIRCFGNDSLLYQFKPYPCDTMFSEIRIDTDNLSEVQYSIIPNPSHGQFIIAGISSGDAYEIFSYTGDLVQSGIYSDQGIELADSGVYIICVEKEKIRWSKKIVIQK